MSLIKVQALRQTGRHEEARMLVVSLAAQEPGNAELQYEAACVHDFLGDESGAVPYYLAALDGCLPDDQARGAYLGLGSTYRALGEYERAEETLSAGLLRFPGANDLKVFLAMVWHNQGKSGAAVETLLQVIAQTSDDKYVSQYRNAIALYARDIGRNWR
jgi:tetratricopeptide (TPR) repeat protein